MKFNSHYDLVGKHAFLSASKYSWIRYDEEKLEEVFLNAQASQLGTELHDFASRAIKLGIKLPRNTKTLNAFVNDAIGYRMATEQVLYYSDNVFGTADAISFRKNILRISDLKTGVSKASFDQLLIYVALFCLEYRYNPEEIEVELRIYQNDEIFAYDCTLEEITDIMAKIVSFDKRIQDIKTQALALV